MRGQLPNTNNPRIWLGSGDCWCQFERDVAYRGKPAIVAVKGGNGDTRDRGYRFEKLGAKGVMGQGTWAHPDIAIIREDIEELTGR
jgi:hypothetical protein